MKSNHFNSQNQQDQIGTKKRLYQLPKKIIFDGNKLTQHNETLQKPSPLFCKNRQDVMEKLCQAILKQSQKIKNDEDFDQFSSSKINHSQDKVIEYNPHQIFGKVKNYRECTQKQYQNYELQIIKGKQFQLNDTYLIIVSGQMGYQFSNDLNLSLYLPKRILYEQDPKICDGKKIILIKKPLLNGNKDSMDYPYIIIQPSIQLYPTYLCSWIECKRLISIQNYIRSERQINQSMVFGNACHRYMQWLINKQVQISTSIQELKNVALKIYNSFLYDMYLINAKFQTFYQYCKKGLSNIRLWVKNHIIEGKQIQVNKFQKTYLKIQTVLGSQIMHRSKFFGLKGKTDCLFKGFLINKALNQSIQVCIPFQLKTGQRVSQSHKKQTDMYCLLIREMYRKNVIGLLYYSETNSAFFREQNPVTSFQMVIVNRNWIVSNLLNLYKSQKIILPKFSNDINNCSRCKISTICQTLHMIVKDQQKPLEIPNNLQTNSQNQDQNNECDSDDQLFNVINSKPKIISDVKDLHSRQVQFIKQQKNQDIQDLPSNQVPSIKQNLSKISQNQFKYLQKWMRWLHFQEYQTLKASQKCQKQGFLNFCIRTTEFKKMMQYTGQKNKKLRFWLQKQNMSLQTLNSLESTYQISQKLRIFVNSLGIIQGCKITQIKKKKNKFFMQIQMNNSQISFSKKKLAYFMNQKQDIDVELQKFQNSFFSIFRNTIYQFILGNNQELKSLVIQNKKHVKLKFQLEKNQGQQKSQQVVQISQDDLGNLNSDQKKAFEKSINCQKFALIQGMPGTGKTQLILRLIQKFDKLGKNILITSFTNRALDNILERMIKSNKIDIEKIIRQGSRYGVTIQHKELNPRQQVFQTLQDYSNYFKRKTIWLVTLSSLGIHHIPQHFDVVILDEASQCLQPACLNALNRAKKFILIGDYKQLQPLVKSQQMSKQGMAISLFQKLCKQFPHEVVALKKQYRMNNQIMKISNKLVYEGQLQIGDNLVKDKKLNFPQNWRQFLKTQEMIDLVDPQHSVRFLNYDGICKSLSKKYRSEQQNIKTILQVQFSCYLFKKLIDLGVEKSNIAIISIYNVIVEKISNLLIKKKLLQSNNGNILTIDKSQGIDKDVIILIVHNRENNFLIQNPRRLNVALTRSKCKLIVIGSEDYLLAMKVWNGNLGCILNQYKIDMTKVLIDEVIEEFQY